ncbi:MAG: hypothetical protein ABIZ52_03110 [Candidatus Limnocylindrales bacterium]
MAYRTRVMIVVGLVMLGALAVIFLGVGVPECLGPLVRTLVESVRDGCVTPTVGLGMPIAIGGVVAGVLLVLPMARNGRRGALVGGAFGAVVGILAYLALRATTITGPTSAGDLITVALPIDVNAAVAAALASGGLGAIIGSRLRTPRRKRASA